MKNITKIKIFILFTLIISSGFALNVSAAELTATITYPNRCDDCPLGWVVVGGHPDCSGGCPGGSKYLACKSCYRLDGDLLPCGSILTSSYASYAAGFKATQVGWTTPLKSNGWSGAASTYPRTCKYNATPPVYICNSNSACGTSGLTGSPFCQYGNVYQNYITYTCNNPGTALSSCSNSTTAQLQTTCTGSQTCANGSCTAVTCATNTACGTSGLTGSPFCQSGNVYQNYTTYTCNNPGTASSSCSNSTTAQLQTTCTGTQTCTNGSCTTSCTQNYQQRCVGSNIYWYDSCGVQGSFIQYCSNGCSGNTCITNTCTYHASQRCSGSYLYWYDSCGTQQELAQYCTNGCSGNACTTNYCTQNSQQRCSGNNLYWYDSCGTQGSLIQYCTNGCSGNACITNNVASTLTATKTAKNLTTNSGFANSINASPSDVVMFMITLQATGQNVQNVLVRDTLPANLIYKNQLVVACTSNGTSGNCTNNIYSYSGDIISGINLNTIYAGQTVTITYQAQLADAVNFAYGITTLNNNITVTSSNTGYVPTNNASIVVTKASVLGATDISTGLTNNFWVDSLLLPLLITLIGIWMWKAGFFFRVEKWLDNKKKTSRGYRAEKELNYRIAQIKKVK